MMMTFITQGGEGRGSTSKKSKATKSKGGCLERGLVALSCARSRRKDVVREVKGKEMMCVLVAGRGARERGGRRLEVKVHWKRRSPCHNVAYLVLETIEESCAFGEDIVLVGLR